MSDTFQFVVPQGVHPGDRFQVLIGSDLITLTCPSNAQSGSKLNLKAIQGRDEIRQISFHQYQRPFPSTGIWLFFEVVLFILFILSCTLHTFAVQKISDSCLVANPYNNKRINTLYYSLYKGLGSATGCDTNGNNFCLEWSDTDVWEQFSSLTADVNPSASVIESDWVAAQVLIPFCAFFIAIAMMFHYSVERNPNNDMASVQSKVALTTSAGNFVAIACLLALIITSVIAYTPSTSAKFWARYYSGGYNIINLIDGSDTAGPIPTDCSVSVYYVDAGILLCIATSLAFFTSFSLLILTCCYPREYPYYGYLDYLFTTVRVASNNPTELQQPRVVYVTSPVDQPSSSTGTSVAPSHTATDRDDGKMRNQESKDDSGGTIATRLPYTVAESSLPVTTAEIVNSNL